MDPRSNVVQLPDGRRPFMNYSKLSLSLLAMIALCAGAVQAASIDMDDPRRALGREGDVRIDAQLMRDTVSPGSPIAITWQVQNLSKDVIAVAPTVADTSYDEDSRTVTLAIGSEVPPDGPMPQMTLIAAGEKKVFRTAAMPALPASVLRRALAAAPRFVQVKVAVLRDVKPFLKLIETAQRPGTARRLSDDLFDKWFECNDTILLNSLPVMYTPASATGADVEARGGAF
jgi:hypothetical protein